MPDHAEIAKRAYILWEIEGRPSGKDLDHWLRAEAEMQVEFTKPADETSGNTARPEIAVVAPVKTQRAAPRRTRRTQ